MSFTGELEHLPIVDILQLLHATRKSGVLRFASCKGESQLVLKDGCIVSANHLNSSVRIGKILVDLDIISPETLNLALQVQLRAGNDRKPLIVTLIEMEAVREEDAYKGLESLNPDLEEGDLHPGNQPGRGFRLLPLLSGTDQPGSPCGYPGDTDGLPAHLRRKNARRRTE